MADSLPLHWLSQWGPFRLDALGIVTMLGSNEVDAAIGRLVFSRYTEYLPLLGAFVVAGNQFTRPLPGFTLYNINDGITTTDWPGWLARYLQSQRTHQSVSTMSLAASDASPRWLDVASAVLVSVIVNAALLVLSIIQGDWWGLANMVSMVVSIVVRALLVWQNRKALDNAMTEAHKVESPVVRILCILPILAFNGSLTRRCGSPDGRMLTVFTASALLFECIVKKPGPPNPRLYKAARVIGWLFFATHIISIGMSSLAVQIATVIVLCGSTVLVANNFGCLETLIGARLRIQRHEKQDKGRISMFKKQDGRPGDRRQNAYIFLEPSDDELHSMLLWNLVPHKINKPWWKEFEMKRQAWTTINAEHEILQRSLGTWASQKTIIASLNSEKSSAP